MIRFYIKEAFRSLKRSKFAALVSVITTTLAILFSSAALLSILLFNVYSERILSRVEARIFLTENVSQADLILLENKLKQNPDISSFELIDKDKSKQELLREIGSDFEEFLETNPLPQSYVVKFNTASLNERSPNSILSSYKKLQFVDDIVTDKDFFLFILNVFDSFKIIVYLLSLFLVLISFYLIYSTNKMIIKNKLDQLNNMKLVGAKISTIKLPQYFFGFMIGITSALFSLFFMALGFILLLKLIGNIKLFDYFNIFVILVFLEGIILGVTGSFIATRSLTLRILR